MRDDWPSERERLVVSAQMGDLVAFDALVLHYRPGLLALVRSLVGEDLAQDAVQDAFVAAYKALPQLQSPDRFGGWLARIARHRALRLGQHRDERTVRLDEVIAAHLTSVTAPEIADQGEVRAAVDDLPADLATVARLYYLDAWSTGEISEFLLLPLTTVKWRLHSARQLLRPRLEHLSEPFL